MHLAINAMKQQIQPAYTHAFSDQHLAQCRRQFSRVARQGFRRADRLGELPPCFDQFQRADWFDRLTQPPERLIQPLMQLRAKTLCERRTWLAGDVHHPFEAEAAQLLHHVPGDAEKGNGKALEQGRALSRRNDKDRPGSGPREGMCGPPATVPPEPGSFEQRLPLPEHWAGLQNEALAAETGVADAVFVHLRRFVAAAKTLDGALALARLAMEDVGK
jgi:hypothetical protein